MRKLVLGGLAMAAYSAMAVTDFPHGATMTDCHRTDSAVVASLQTPVQVPQTRAMQAAESVAVVCMSNTFVQAMDEEDWATSTNEIAKTGAQAAFSLLAEGDTPTLKWMGYTGSGWVELEGVTPEEGTYDVKIDLDYSLSYGGGSQKIRYSIKKSTDASYTPLSNSDSAWVAIGKAAQVIAGVDLYGFVTTGPVFAQAGARPAEGAIAKVEDVSMSYDKITIKVAATDTWGVDKVVVTLKNRFEGVVDVVTQTLAQAVGGTNTFDLSNSIYQGHSYTYDVQLLGSYDGTTAITTPSAPSGVDLYSPGDWFRFTGTDFVNATNDANITISDGAFFATDEDVEGKILPTNAAPANVGTVVTTKMAISGVCTELPTFGDTDRPQFAIALGGTDASRRWKYYSSFDNAWHDGFEDLPTANGNYEGRATFDYSSLGKPVVVYEIRVDADGSFFQPLAATVDIMSNKTKLDAVAIRGGGSVSALDATVKLAEPPPVTPVDDTITVTKNAKVELKDLTAGTVYTVNKADGAHFKWTDAPGKYAKVNASTGKLEVKSGDPANGLSSYHSHVLGLDADNVQDKPAAVIKPGAVQSAGDGIPVYVPNVTPRSDVGYKVYLQRQVKDGANWRDDGEAVPIEDANANGTMKVPLNGNVYRVNTILK